MSMFSLLLHSAAFWSALISIVGLVALKYLGIPEDIWTGFAVLLGVIVTILTGDGIARATGSQIAKSQREYWEVEKRGEIYRGLQSQDLEPKG